MSRSPTYPLAELQALVRAKHYRVRRPARDGLSELRLDEADLTDCVCSLDLGDFYKTMPSEHAPGLWQDVYRPTYAGRSIYLKLQFVAAIGAVVISFKRDESR